MKLLPPALATLLLLTPPAAAQDFAKGWQAYRSGDFAAAQQEWRPLAEQGNAAAQFNLGLMYYKGEGVAQDFAEAVKWFRLAAAQGQANAQHNLGVKYAKGEGVPQDHVLAHMWFNLAAAQGFEAAAENRGIMAGLMTPAQIAEAQQRARAWLAEHGE